MPLKIKDIFISVSYTHLSGEIGEVQRIETSFCSDVDYQEGHYLFDKEQGGVLYDVGTYNIATTLDYITSPLQKVSTQVIYKNGEMCIRDRLLSGVIA